MSYDSAFLIRETGGGSEPGVDLGEVLLRVIHWFLSITEKCLQQLPSNASQMTPLLNIACDGITTTWESGVTSALIIIAKSEDDNTMHQINYVENNLRSAMNLLQSHANFNAELQEKMLVVLKTINRYTTSNQIKSKLK